MEKQLLLEMTIIGINYLAARGINMDKVRELQDKNNGILTAADLMAMEAVSQAAIDSIDVNTDSLQPE